MAPKPPHGFSRYMRVILHSEKSDSRAPPWGSGSSVLIPGNLTPRTEKQEAGGAAGAPQLPWARVEYDRPRADAPRPPTSDYRASATDRAGAGDTRGQGQPSGSLDYNQASWREFSRSRGICSVLDTPLVGGTCDGRKLAAVTKQKAGEPHPRAHCPELHTTAPGVLGQSSPAVEGRCRLAKPCCGRSVPG